MIPALIKWLSGWAVCGAVSACALTIAPTFDSSITNSPAAAAMESSINAAIQAFETNYTDSLTVNILFVNDPTTSLGENSTWGTSVPYQQYIAALRSRATSANDTNAISQLPNSATDPVIGGSQIAINLTLARLMGLVPPGTYGDSNLDSTISLNMSLMNFTRPATNSSRYDLVSVVEHEVDEVLGTSSSLPETDIITPIDLFRYTTNLARTFTTGGGDNAYFSVDGTNLWARYNTNPTGDYGDWWSDRDVYWAPLGITPHPQVQDAFGTAGKIQDMATNELSALDVVGYTLATSPPQPAPTLSIVRNGASQVTLSWSTNAAGYSLQERTNLIFGSWTASATGSNNPASVAPSATRKFYRLDKAASSSLTPALASEVPSATTVPLTLRTRVLRAGQP